MTLRTDAIAERRSGAVVRGTAFAAQRPTKRRRAVGALGVLAVFAFAAAILSPTGMALARPSAAEADEVSAFSLAALQVQSIAVSAEAGASIEPIKRGSFEVYVTPKPEPVVEVAAAGPSTAYAAPLMYTGGGSPAEWMAAAGIAESDWGYVNYIVQRESGWNPNATNSSSGACGLVQALPCSKVPGNGYDPVDNLRWANGYAVGRYGSWAGAYDFWVNNHWW